MKKSLLVLTMYLFVVSAMATADVITFTDDFERPDSSTLGDNWTMTTPEDWAIVSGAVVNQVHVLNYNHGNVANTVYIDGAFSVSITSLFSPPESQLGRLAEGISFHVQEDGTAYFARIRRTDGYVQIGKYSTTDAFGTLGLVYAGIPLSGSFSNTDILQMTITGDNAGNCTLEIQNVTQGTTGSTSFQTSTDNNGNPVEYLTGGGLGFDSTDSYLAGALHYQSFSATAEAVPEPATLGLLTAGGLFVAIRRRRK